MENVNKYLYITPNDQEALLVLKAVRGLGAAWSKFDLLTKDDKFIIFAHNMWTDISELDPTPKESFQNELLRAQDVIRGIGYAITLQGQLL